MYEFALVDFKKLSGMWAREQGHWMTLDDIGKQLVKKLQSKKKSEKEHRING